MALGKKKYSRLMKLEAMRGISALYVMIHHYAHGNAELEFIRPIFILGQFALMVFFILSGFVIYYATVYRNPNLSFKEFPFRRFRRIYPALILVMVLTYFFRRYTSGVWLDFHVWEFFGNLIMMQDKNPASWVDPYWQNAPLWSLAYEWWFYMLFFGLWKLTQNQPKTQKFIVMGMSVLGFATYWIIPNQISLFLSYFILWWGGLELAREWTETGKITLKTQWKTWAGIFGMGVLWSVPAGLFIYAGNKVVLAEFPLVQPRHFFTVFLVLCAGYTWYKLKWVLFDKLIGPFAFLAPISYVIYTFHYPVIFLAARLRPAGNVWLDLIWVLPTIVAVAWLIEQPFQKWINSWMKLKPSKRAA